MENLSDAQFFGIVFLIAVCGPSLIGFIYCVIRDMIKAYRNRARQPMAKFNRPKRTLIKR